MSQILLIEPDRILAEVYKRALEQRGHQIVPVSSAQAAILAADERRPDIVILELQLIEHSGIEFLYEFRSYQDWQDIPVLIQTHVPPGEFAHTGHLLNEQLNIAGYLHKPYATLRQLISAVREATVLVA